MSPEIDTLYAAHLREIAARTARALADSGFDGLVAASGTPVPLFLDDQEHPFRANPHYRSWLPDATPGCFVVFEPGHRPKLLFYQPQDYWHLPPALPEGYWVRHFDLVVLRDPGEAGRHLRPGQRLAMIGPPGGPMDGLGEPNPPALLDRLHYARAAKTPYEIECLRRASLTGARAHLAAERAFRAGASEYEIHLEYCRAAQARAQDLPYNNIIALGTHGAVLHYQHLERVRRPGAPSFLIDAGATFGGYASDITRTWSARDDDFAALVRSVDRLQQELVAMVRPGIPYPDIHLAAHRLVAATLVEHRIVRVPADAAVATGLTSVFFPHGIGHLLGLQVHDVGGRMAGPEGGEIPQPPGHPFLRLTRTLAPGFVVTIEPGIYFIDMLLAEARAGAHRNAIDWDRVAALAPCGGVRIEDDVVARDGTPENITRAAFEQAAA